MDDQRAGNRLARIGRLPLPAMFMVATVLTVVAVAILTALAMGAITLVDGAGLPDWSLILLGIPACLVCWVLLRRSKRLDER